MGFKKKVLCAMLSLTVLALATSSESSIAIKDKPLDEIGDIVSLTTGSEKAELKKYSLGLVSFRGTQNRKELYLKQIGEKASEFVTYSGDISAAEVGSVLSGMHIAASSSSTKSGRAIFGTNYTVDTANSKLTVRPYAAFVGSDGKVADVKSLELTTSHNAVGDAYDQDVQGRQTR